MQTRRFATKLIAAALAIVCVATSVSAGNPNSKVAPLRSHPHGLSYAEWSAEHWQWLYSLPVDAHPLFDTADCSAGQSGNVWFLGGTFSTVETGPGVVVGEVDRECRIPSGTALFFPLINAEASTIEGNGETEMELREGAIFFADFMDADSVFLEIDGQAANVTDYRVESPLFTFGPLPANNILAAFGYEAPEGATSLSVADGYYAFIKPLSVGKHTLHFGGEADFSSVGGPLFIQDIKYTVTVVPRGRY
jgi:hypothetical protein